MDEAQHNWTICQWDPHYAKNQSSEKLLKLAKKVNVS